MDYRSRYTGLTDSVVPKIVISVVLAFFASIKFSMEAGIINGIIFFLILSFLLFVIIALVWMGITTPQQKRVYNDKIYHDVPPNTVTFDKYHDKPVSLVALQFEENGPYTLYATTDMMDNNIIGDEAVFIHPQEYSRIPRFASTERASTTPQRVQEKEFEFKRLLPNGKIDTEPYVMRLDVIVD